MTKTDLLMKEFMFGHQDNLTQEEEKYLETVKNWRNFKAFTFLEWTRQYCNHAFISSNFRGLNFTWRNLKKEEIYYKISYGPRFHPTDFGACCRLVPHLFFEKQPKNISMEEWWFNTKVVFI